MGNIKVSVIIPLAPNDIISAKLEQQLLLLPDDWEILFCSPKLENRKIFNRVNFEYVLTKGGRANCLNEGAKHATGEYLWFLHSDSILSSKTILKLEKIIEKDIPALYYFDLAFYESNSYLIKINEWGVLFRCRCLKTPFGDQGFFIKKMLFNKFGDYPINAEYGEDHLFIRKLRRNKIPIKPVGIKLYTSARKYKINGWFKTTIKHLYLWQKQVYYCKKEYRNERKNENCSSNILQNSRRFSSKNSFGNRNRHKAS